MFAGCEAGRKQASYFPQASEYTAQAAMMIYGTDPDRALTMIDSARIVGNIDEYFADFLRAKVYANSIEDPRPDAAIALCLQLLQHDSTQAVTASRADNRDEVLQLMMDAYRRKKDDEQWLKYAIERVQLIQTWGQETEALRSEADIALVLTHLGREEEGMAKLDGVIKALEAGSPSVDRMDASIVALKRKISILEEQGRFAEIIPLAQRIQKKIEDYQRRPSAYAEDSYRLPPIPEDRARYCAFCQAQAWGYMARAYARETPLRIAEVEKYVTLFEQTDYGRTYGGRKMIIPGWKALGRWDEVLSVEDEMVARMEADTLNPDYAVILKDRAEEASARGEHAEALAWMSRSSALEQALHRQLQASEAQKYAARYHADEQQKKIQEVETRSARKTLVIWIIAVVVAVLAVLEFYLVRRRKNGQEKNGAEPQSPADPQLFQHIDHEIREQRLYAKESLQRQDILDYFKISRRNLSDLLATYAEGKSFTNYINDIRMQEAETLLRENPEMSLTEVAETVGFSPATMRNQFKNRYGLTPREYRTQQKQS